MTESSRTVQPEKTTVTPSFPTGRVKKIMKLDKDISKINAEALFLVSCSADLFLSFLSDISSSVSASFNRRTVSLDHFRAAVSAHRPTSDFLLDSLPKASLPAHHNNYKKKVDDDVQEQQLPRGTQKIDRFFSKTGLAQGLIIGLDHFRFLIKFPTEGGFASSADHGEGSGGGEVASALDTEDRAVL